uniref:Uncharacterized protein n=1 Tax=Arundo donax TaxID=35708 RepID=A0A0A9AI38_ARUDO
MSAPTGDAMKKNGTTPISNSGPSTTPGSSSGLGGAPVSIAGSMGHLLLEAPPPRVDGNISQMMLPPPALGSKRPAGDSTSGSQCRNVGILYNTNWNTFKSRCWQWHWDTRDGHR